MNVARAFALATRELATAVDRLKFGAAVGYVYNPLLYAWAAHKEYLNRYLRGRQKVLFVGMNPGPFGMAQTGVPFGEISAVRDWLGIEVEIGRPKKEHPAKPVLGFQCPRSEVSGRRLWGLFARKFGPAERFFADHFVYNYCPLLFLDGGRTGRNLTPENLSGEAMERLLQLCDQHLLRLMQCSGARWAIGVGNFAEKRLRQLVGGDGIRVARILHPSPANPAANRDWDGAVAAELERLGIW